MKRIILAGIFLGLGWSANAQITSDDISGTWLLAGGGCWNESPKVYKTLGEEAWIFTGTTYVQSQRASEGAEDPACRPSATGSYEILQDPDGGFRIRLGFDSKKTCLINTQHGIYTIRSPQYNRTLSYDNLKSLFRLEKFQGMDALVEEAFPPYTACHLGKYRYYYVRAPGT